MSADDFIVTPWHVEGDIDYDKLIKKFGTEKISSELQIESRKLRGKTISCSEEVFSSLIEK